VNKASEETRPGLLVVPDNGLHPGKPGDQPRVTPGDFGRQITWPSSFGRKLLLFVDRRGLLALDIPLSRASASCAPSVLQNWVAASLERWRNRWFPIDDLPTTTAPLRAEVYPCLRNE
jgi:hypothetical protein